MGILLREKGPGEYILKFKAKIDAGWKLLATTQGDELNSRIAFDSLSDTRAAIQSTADTKAPSPPKSPCSITLRSNTLRMKRKSPLPSSIPPIPSKTSVVQCISS